MRVALNMQRKDTSAVIETTLLYQFNYSSLRCGSYFYMSKVDHLMCSATYVSVQGIRLRARVPPGANLSALGFRAAPDGMAMGV